MNTLLFGIGVCLVLRTAAGQFEGDCDPAVIDECGYKMYDTLMHPHKTPQNQAELDAYCTNFKDGQDCIKEKLNKCPTIFPEALANSYIESLKYSYDDVCVKDLGKKMIQYSPCVKEKLSNFNCTTDFFNKIQAAPYEDSSNQMAAVCCALFKYDRCYTGAVKENCGKKSGRELRAAAQGFVVFILDKCLPHLAEPEKCEWRQAKSLPADAPEYKSILPSIALVIAQTLPQDE